MPTIPVEKEIRTLLKEYSTMYCKSIYDANKFLSDRCAGYFNNYPFKSPFTYKEAVYIFKQVLIRYQLSASFDYVETAKNLNLGRSTLYEIRNADKGNLSIHMPYGGF